MPRVRSTWLVGSIEALPVQSFTIDDISVEIASGSRYLYAADPSLSLLAEFEAQMDEALLVGASAVVLENRRVRISAADVFEVAWGSATQLRDLLGFTGDLSGAASYTAPQISPLLWSGGEVSRAMPSGAVGYPVEDAEISVSADGSRQITTHFATHYHDDWTWEAVHLSRYWSASGEGGTWHTFRTRVVVPGHRFLMFETVTEDTASTTPVTWPTAAGVYRMREIPPGKGDRVTGFEASNTYWRVGMSVRITEDY